MIVHAPYHYIPLNSWVFLPDWSGQVSHDIPFKAGLCGTIKYKLTNQSPLLVGGKHTPQKDGSTLVEWEEDDNNNPLIPGSTIKGLLKSMLGITTFGKTTQVSDEKLSYRNFQNIVYKNLLNETKVKSAWLKYNDKSNKWQYHIVETIKIEDQVLDSKLNKDPDKFFKKKAIVKYKKYPLNKIQYFSTKTIQKLDRDKKLYSVKYVENIINKTEKIKSNNHQKGYLAFTSMRIGADRKDRRKKYYVNEKLWFNYIFPQPKNDYKNIPDQTVVKKLFEHNDKDLIKYLKKHQNKDYGIPVFLRVNKKNEKDIKAIGLANLPRIPYENRLVDLIEREQKLTMEQNPLQKQYIYDYTDCVLGTIRKHGLSIKSRLDFDDALCKKSTGYRDETVNKLLAEPHASCLAVNLENPDANEDGEKPIIGKDRYGNNTHKNLNDYNKLSNQPKGRRIQIIKDKCDFKSDIDTKNDNKKQISRLKLLNENSTFIGTIHFHNLLPQELGAVLYGLTFGQVETNSEKNYDYYHGIGLGKAFGFGNCQIQLESLETIANDLQTTSEEEIQPQNYIDQFTMFMDKKYQKAQTQDKEIKWQESPQIQHLLAFSQLNSVDDLNLKYMSLEGKGNTFKNIQNKYALPDFKGLERKEETFNKKVKTSQIKGKLSDLFRECKVISKEAVKYNNSSLQDKLSMLKNKFS